jgi:hypothetical protein
MNIVSKNRKTPVKPFNRNTAMLQSLLAKGHRAAEGELVLYATLSTSGTYTFQVNENQNKLVSEIRLRQGDAFIPTSMGLYIGKVASATPTDAQIAAVEKNTFPNAITFSKSGEAANLQAIYNSRIQIQVNSVNITETLSTQRFYRVGVAQKGVLTTATGTNGVYQASEWTNENYGMCPVSQAFAFNGIQNNIVNLLLPAAVDCTGTTSTNYAILVFKGLQVINGAGSVTDASISAFNR